jgi:hypothetical protein
MLKRVQKWSVDEDDLLRRQIVQFGKQWSVIASHIPNRTATQIAARWEKCIDPKLTKGTFTREEDQLIVSFVRENGTRSWPKITRIIPHRTPKQCRERWFNNLDPSVVKDPWTGEEDRRIFEAYLTHGPKWSVIAHDLPGRTDNAIKNRWNASISKRMHIGDEGRQVLGPNKVRKYSRRKVREPVRQDPAAEQAKREIDSDGMEFQITPVDLTGVALEDPTDRPGYREDFGAVAPDGGELDFF